MYNETQGALNRLMVPVFLMLFISPMCCCPTCGIQWEAGDLVAIDKCALMGDTMVRLGAWSIAMVIFLGDYN